MTIDKKKLEEIYLKYPLKKAAEHFGISVPTLLKKIKENDIKMKGSGRPYDSGSAVYVSSETFDYFKDITDPATIGVFVLLLVDKTFIKNNWNGNSNIQTEEFGGDRLPNLEELYKAGFIGPYEAIGGKISTSIKDRSKFVLTEDEYLKLEAN